MREAISSTSPSSARGRRRLSFLSSSDSCLRWKNILHPLAWTTRSTGGGAVSLRGQRSLIRAIRRAPSLRVRIAAARETSLLAIEESGGDESGGDAWTSYVRLNAPKTYWF